jgi:large subunit ribosomal protein L7/L12
MTNRIWSADIRDLGERIAALTIARAAELGQYLEEVHGIQAARAPVLVPVADEPVEEAPAEPAAFDVVLDGFDLPRRIVVIRVVREVTGLGLKEARDLVEAGPTAVKECLPRAEAELLQARLEAAGARVSLQASTP